MNSRPETYKVPTLTTELLPHEPAHYASRYGGMQESSQHARENRNPFAADGMIYFLRGRNRIDSLALPKMHRVEVTVLHLIRELAESNRRCIKLFLEGKERENIHYILEVCTDTSQLP